MQPCEYEDSVNCFWDAQTRGNGEGMSFTVDADGNVTYVHPPTAPVEPAVVEYVQPTPVFVAEGVEIPQPIEEPAPEVPAPVEVEVIEVPVSVPDAPQDGEVLSNMDAAGLWLIVGAAIVVAVAASWLVFKGIEMFNLRDGE